MDSTADNSASSQLTDAQRQRSMKFAMISALANIIGFAAFSGNVLTLVAVKLGAREFFLGLLHFAVMAPMFLGLFTISVVERRGKLHVMRRWWSVQIVFILPILFLPFLVSRVSPSSCLGLLLVSTLLWRGGTSLGVTGWFPILHDCVPSDITGKFFARMRTFWQTGWLIWLMAIAWLLRGNGPTDWWRFQLIFIIGALAYIVRVLALIPMSENPPQSNTKTRAAIVKRFKQLFATKYLSILAVYLVFYAIAATISEPFKIKLMKNFGYSDGFIIAAAAMTTLGAIASLRFWGSLADKFGNRSIFSIAHIGMIVIAMLWIMVEKSGFGAVLIFILYFFWGIFTSGNGIAQTRYILHTVPATKQFYINLLNFVSFAFCAIGPLVGGIFLTATTNVRMKSGAVDLNNYQIMFVITALLFVIPHMLRKKLRWKKETPTTQVLATVIRPLRNVFGPFIRIDKKTED